MSENLVYKNEYDSDDVYLRDLQTVFNEIAGTLLRVRPILPQFRF